MNRQTQIPGTGSELIEKITKLGNKLVTLKQKGKEVKRQIDTTCEALLSEMKTRGLNHYQCPESGVKVDVKKGTDKVEAEPGQSDKDAEKKANKK